MLPRATLTKMAPGFMASMAARSIRSAVSGVPAAARTTTSLRDRTSCSDEGPNSESTFGAVIPGCQLRLMASTSTPKGLIRSATALADGAQPHDGDRRTPQEPAEAGRPVVALLQLGQLGEVLVELDDPADDELGDRRRPDPDGIGQHDPGVVEVAGRELPDTRAHGLDPAQLGRHRRELEGSVESEEHLGPAEGGELLGIEGGLGCPQLGVEWAQAFGGAQIGAVLVRAQDHLDPRAHPGQLVEIDQLLDAGIGEVDDERAFGCGHGYGIRAKRRRAFSPRNLRFWSSLRSLRSTILSSASQSAS